MATRERLQKIVTGLIDEGYIYPEMSHSQLKNFFSNRVQRLVRCPEPIYDQKRGETRWQSPEDARFWGAGPNENFESFEACAVQLLWGRNDYIPPPERWPEKYSRAGRRDAAEWGIHPSSLPALSELQVLPEFDDLWHHFLALRVERSANSSYAFGSLKAYVEIVKSLGAKKSLKYKHAKTWREIARFVSSGIDPRHALILHSRTHAVQVGPWLADVIAAYGLRNVFEAIENNCSTEQAIRVYCRGGKAKSWMEDIRQFMSDEWKNVPASMIMRIPDDAYGNVKDMKYKEALLRGVSPRDLTNGLLNGPQAARWLAAGCPKLSEWWALTVLGLTKQECERLVGWQGITGRRQVFEWYARKKATAGFQREREWTLETGETIRVSLAALLDEITEEDLVNGINTSPDTVFSRVMTRGVTYITGADEQTKAALRRMSEKKLEERLNSPFALLPDLRETEHVKQIRNRQQLTDEGNIMRNCIGRYVECCVDGDAYMFVVQVGNYRSNVQVSYDRTVVQHYGKCNQAPPSPCVEALRQFCMLNRIKINED